MTTPLAPPLPAPPRSFAAFHNPGYRAFFATNMLAMMADSVEHVILALAAANGGWIRLRRAS